ncbi:mitotic interactor and substrate of PLK1 [Talpa occidentalis]|uniref:mitotic interactor and substrate of PLK1 n=1 Tax=Talpa occidentalis TaxID=50954 RepID=UPI00188E3504|nr:mitotic interactor and substrate of PLK1 [Talpa occidentalis]
MDRVTRYPIFSSSYSPRVTGLALDGDTSYTFRLVGVGPEASDWSQDEPQGWPAGHKARLDVVQTGVSRTLQGSPSRLSQWPLCPEDNEDEEINAYLLDSRDALPRRPWDLERERREVIQGQVVKKSGTVATLHGTPDHRDPKTPGQPQLMSPNENAVDTEQIDFLAARQQFLSLEQANGEVPQTPPARVAPTYTTPRASQAPKPLNSLPRANGYTVPTKPQAKEAVEEKSSRTWSIRSGVRAVASPASWSQEESPELPKETPIEREIRLAQERERDLREQRGLRRAASHQELVEIPTRPLLAKVSLTTPPRRDRGRPSLYVQRDIAQETQREEDHRREGLQVDRAATPDWVSQGPQPALRRVLSSDSILSLAPDASAADPPPEMRKVNRIPPDAYHPYLGSGTPPLEFPASRTYGKARGLPEYEAKTVGSPKVAGSQRRLSESSGKTSGIKQEHWKPQQGPLQADGGVVRREYFLLRPLRFRFPDTPQRDEDPRGRDWPVAGTPMFRLQRSQSSELLEKEVENVLRREREVAEERRNALFPQVFSPTWDEDSDQDSSSSRASGTTGSYCVNEPCSLTPERVHSGPRWTAEAPSEDGSGRTKKEQWYAGINPSDRVDSAVLEATRVTRRKSAMAERWEARIYAGEDEE